MANQVKQQIRNALTLSAILATAPITASANEVTEPDTLTVINKALAIEEASIQKLELKKQTTPEVAKAQRLNVENELKATKDRVEKLRSDLKREQERLADEERKAKLEAEKRAKEQVTLNSLNGIVTPGQLNENDLVYDYEGAVTYPQLQCTWGAKVLAPWAGQYWGNGGQWGASAAAAGFRTGTTPQVGALISWNDGSYGHIAYVVAVESETRIQVMEANYGGTAFAADPRGIGNYRGWFNPIGIQGQVTYIYPNT